MIIVLTIIYVCLDCIESAIYQINPPSFPLNKGWDPSKKHFYRTCQQRGFGGGGKPLVRLENVIFFVRAGRNARNFMIIK